MHVISFRLIYKMIIKYLSKWLDLEYFCTKFELIKLILPPIVCWELWRSKYAGKQWRKQDFTKGIQKKIKNKHAKKLRGFSI